MEQKLAIRSISVSLVTSAVFKNNTGLFIDEMLNSGDDGGISKALNLVENNFARHKTSHLHRSSESSLTRLRRMNAGCGSTLCLLFFCLNVQVDIEMHHRKKSRLHLIAHNALSVLSRSEKKEKLYKCSFNFHRLTRFAKRG